MLEGFVLGSEDIEESGFGSFVCAISCGMREEKFWFQTIVARRGIDKGEPALLVSVSEKHHMYLS